MGLFNFLQFRKNPEEKRLEDKAKPMCPKGKKDIQAGTEELLYILDDKVDYKMAKTIFLKAITASRLSKKFKRDKLEEHLAEYCIQYFTPTQIDKFHRYLESLQVAMSIRGKSPADVEKKGHSYTW